MDAAETPARKGTFAADALASVVGFLVALPLCMGIASGLPVERGIVTGIVGGLVVGFRSRQPLQVSEPVAGRASHDRRRALSTRRGGRSWI